MIRRSDDQKMGARSFDRLIFSFSDLLIRPALSLLGILTMGISVSAQRSPFNGLEVLPADSTGHYRIVIGGHLHGASTNRSGYPAATLLANIDTINALGANLFLSAGDLFMDPVGDSARYQRSLFSRLKMPFFNAPGNHDLSNVPTRGFAHRNIQGVSMGFRCSWGMLDALDSARRSEALSELFFSDEALLLDLEDSDGNVDVAQLQSLASIEEQRPVGFCGTPVPTKKQVFIISHRPIWAEDDPQYSPLFEGNTRSLTGTNFRKDVYPLLEKIAEHAHVYWISGSMGGQAPSSIFFQQHAHNITYIQCAIRDEPRDALLIADVYPDTVKWSAISLTGQKLLAPEAYDAAWWRAHIGRSEGFNWRLLPYLVKVTVTHRAFRWGILAGGVLVYLLSRVVRRRRKV